MNLKLKTLLVTAALTATSLALAGPGQHGRGIEHLTRTLDLTEEQTTTISALIDDHREHMREEIRWKDADGNPNPEAREQARAAKESLHDAIAAVLTPEQAEQFEALGERRKRHTRRHRGGKRMAYALGKLDLTPEQKEALAALRAEHKAGGRLSRDEFRAELETILTPEQQAELEAMKSDRRRARD